MSSLSTLLITAGMKLMC